MIVDTVFLRNWEYDDTIQLSKIGGQAMTQRMKKGILLLAALLCLLLCACTAAPEGEPTQPTPEVTPTPVPTPVPLNQPLELNLPLELTDGDAATWVGGYVVLHNPERKIGSV